MNEKKADEALEFITVSSSREHNLKDISLRIPLNRLTLVCGVSGSGKSTLAHDVLFCEGQGRFLESFSAYARIFQARMNRSHTDAITNIPPALALGQRLSLNNPRSTVCTLTDLHSPLRMLFSRFSKQTPGEKITRSHLSFNHPLGACPDCQGLGQVHEIDLAALITDENRSLREGALSLSTPNGYIIYSQVTIDALDQVCRAHGFTVDIPWKKLTDEQKQIVFYGSDRVQIPFGKHTLTSRLKWTGITPKPRGLGIYRGIVPIMEEILQKDPNPNILRFCRQKTCLACSGLRLARRFLDTTYRKTSLRALLSLSIAQLADWGQKESARPALSRPERILLSQLTVHALLLNDLSLGHLVLQRAVPTLSRSEGQRIQIANLLKNPISGMLYVLDEPGSGLHPFEKKRLYRQLRNLVAIGGSVVMVSHDRQALQFADWVVELGPVGGDKGGHLLFCGATRQYLDARTHDHVQTPTTSAWRKHAVPAGNGEAFDPNWLVAGPIRENILSIGTLTFPVQAITVVSGLSGSGKTTLLEHLARQGPESLRTAQALRRLVMVDQQPLGKNVRSNPATYTKLFDDIRKLFAAQPGARELGLNASSFSFNTDQGCCATCQGAGVLEITMHYMQSLFQPCPQCQGRRYQDNVLAFRYQGLAIDEVLDLTIDQALEFFAAEAKISVRLKILSDLGLGYLTLGQPSSTLSGGEAQRVRLTSFIQNGKAHGSLYLLDEPCMGLHDQDIPFLVRALKKLAAQGATLLVAENNPRFIGHCDWLIELSGQGNSLYSGEVSGASQQEKSLVAAMLAGKDLPGISERNEANDAAATERTESFIHMRGVRTHNLRNISVSIPERSFTVVSGPSGSGKSSLILETLYKTCQRRYAEQLSPFLRDRLSLAGEDDCDEINPLKPAVALAARYLEATPRSTVGTLSGINDALRVLFSRLGQVGTQGAGITLHASHFSFNHHDGACPACNGLGHVHEADISRWVVDPGKNIFEGAFSEDKLCQFFLNPNGRFMAILRCAAQARAIDITRSWRELSREAQALILDGGAGNFAVTWKFKRGQRSGEHHFKSEWIGFNRLVLQDYQQKKERRTLRDLYEAVVFKKACPTCQGLRLRGFVLQSRVGRVTLAEILTAPFTRLEKLLENNGAAFFIEPYSKFKICSQKPTNFRICYPRLLPSSAGPEPPSPKEQLLSAEIMPILFRQCRSLINLGIGYLTLSRAVNTLSSGEHQRLRLASLLANRLNHTMFIIDEISRGLHPLDIAGLLASLRTLLPGGNTIVAVDHHPLVTTQADWIIQLGPGSGSRGGQLLFMGKEKPSPQAAIRVAATTSPEPQEQDIVIASASIHNLKGLDLRIPGRGLTVLCGVSGSGKSTLLHRVVHESAVAGRPVNCAGLCGLDRFKQVSLFTPVNPVRTGNERLSDFLGSTAIIYDEFLRSASGTAGHTNHKKSTLGKISARACSHCDGKGEWETDLDYLGSFVEPCRYCRGSGLANELSSLILAGQSLADFLAGDIDALPAELLERCRLDQAVRHLREFALGHLSLGRRLSSLSGGELQRLRLARLFMELQVAPGLLLLDEPDSGLGGGECRQLIETIKNYLHQGHAAIVISHQPLMMVQADFIIDLGPDAGEDGGRLVACGTPYELLTGNWPLSKTAAYLKQISSSSII